LVVSQDNFIHRAALCLVSLLFRNLYGRIILLSATSRQSSKLSCFASPLVRFSPQIRGERMRCW
jgi:hypothetical protein